MAFLFIQRRSSKSVKTCRLNLFAAKIALPMNFCPILYLNKIRTALILAGFSLYGTRSSTRRDRVRILIKKFQKQQHLESKSYKNQPGLESCSIRTKSSLDLCSSNHNPFWILYRIKRKSCSDLNLEKIPGYPIRVLPIRVLQSIVALF